MVYSAISPTGCFSYSASSFAAGFQWVSFMAAYSSSHCSTGPGQCELHWCKLLHVMPCNALFSESKKTFLCSSLPQDFKLALRCKIDVHSELVSMLWWLSQRKKSSLVLHHIHAGDLCQYWACIHAMSTLWCTIYYQSPISMNINAKNVFVQTQLLRAYIANCPRYQGHREAAKNSLEYRSLEKENEVLWHSVSFLFSHSV